MCSQQPTRQPLSINRQPLSRRKHGAAVKMPLVAQHVWCPLATTGQHDTTQRREPDGQRQRVESVEKRAEHVDQDVA